MSSIAINNRMNPIKIAYATLAYFTMIAVTTPPTVAAIPEEIKSATKK